MRKTFMKIFLLLFTALFLIDWLLGVLRFSSPAALTVFKILNIPFGVIALRLEATVPPMTDSALVERLTIPVFCTAVVLQAGLYTVVFLLAKFLWDSEKVRAVIRHIPH